MAHARLDLETLTPMFLGGAYPLGEPELRPSSFRGMLRFWWRALYGGARGMDDLSALRQAEAEVFGNTESGSPVIVRVQGNAQSQAFQSNARGVQYLFWSVIRTRRRCLPAGTRFTLTLQTRPGTRNNEPLKRALASLWLLTRCGGLGARSRRGAGSLQIVGPPQTTSADLLEGLPDFAISATQPGQLRDEMANGLQKLRTLFGTPTNASLTNPDFDVLHPDCCRVVVIDKSWSTWEQALHEVGEKFQAFRSRRQPDYGNVKDAVRGKTNSLSPVQRAAFGLPIVFYYRSLGGQQGTLEGEDHDRRASPLMMRVVRLANPRFAVVLTVFKSELLDDSYDEGLKLKRSGSPPAIGDPPDLSIIDEFIAELTTRNSGHFVAPGLEVNYR